MNEDLKRILLNMKYDSKKTLSENLDRIILNEEEKPIEALDGGYHRNKNIYLYVLTGGGPVISENPELGEKNDKLTVWEVNFNNVKRWSPNAGKFEKLTTKTGYLFCGEKDGKTFATNTLKDSTESYSPVTEFEPNGTIGKQLRYWCETHTNEDAMKNVAKSAPGSPGKVKEMFDSLDTKLTGYFVNFGDLNKKVDNEEIKNTEDNTTNKIPKKTTIKSSWNTTCKGTYSMSCKTPEVGQAQQCLKDQGLYNLYVDNKFGSRTRTAVYNKLGKSSFTDADLQTICKTKEGSGSSGDDLSDFNQDYNQEKGSDREKEDTTWTGDLY